MLRLGFGSLFDLHQLQPASDESYLVSMRRAFPTSIRLSGLVLTDFGTAINADVIGFSRAHTYHSVTHILFIRISSHSLGNYSISLLPHRPRASTKKSSKSPGHPTQT